MTLYTFDDRDWRIECTSILVRFHESASPIKMPSVSTIRIILQVVYNWKSLTPHRTFYMLLAMEYFASLYGWWIYYLASEGQKVKSTCIKFFSYARIRKHPLRDIMLWIQVYNCYEKQLPRNLSVCRLELCSSVKYSALMYPLIYMIIYGTTFVWKWYLLLSVAKSNGMLKLSSTRVITQTQTISPNARFRMSDHVWRFQT